MLPSNGPDVDSRTRLRRQADGSTHAARGGKTLIDLVHIDARPGLAYDTKCAPPCIPELRPCMPAVHSGLAAAADTYPPCSKWGPESLDTAGAELQGSMETSNGLTA